MRAEDGRNGKVARMRARAREVCAGPARTSGSGVMDWFREGMVAPWEALAPDMDTGCRDGGYLRAEMPPFQIRK